ncbi:hypothetical protein CAC42_4989 [Sphaceloma murrayae]|uniref:SsuA/THI5-like domain-containing protein n=1 Tax=Sphaceloma murrayae TaxID=2082308 RepID=A0A2K1QPM0_9PEZI|nr:hypothetical protein CAC42_4989 [Sphaceloma murrayae]
MRSVPYILAAVAGINLPFVTAHLDNINYGAFTQTASYSIANRLGIFTAYGLSVTYLQVPNSTYGYAQVPNGGYDILTGTIDNLANLRFNQGRPLTVLGLLDAGPDLTIASVGSITSILDLRGKSLMVDSATSGYAFLLGKVLSLYGLRLENGDYTFTVVGGTNIRYAALRNGTFNGQPVFATTALVTRFVSAVYDANRYLASTVDGDRSCAVQAIATQLGIDTEVAELEYAAATDSIIGEISAGQQGNLTVDRQGLLNVLDVRTQFGGFGNATIGFNFVDGIEPGKGKTIDYSILTEAIAGSKGVQVDC